MLLKSFGAPSFEQFWWYWNPIWGYYLSKYVLRPVGKILPPWLSVLVTFAVSGFLHDLAVALIKLQPFLFFTPWFACMGLIVVLSKSMGWQYQATSLIARILINSGILIGSFYLIRYCLA
jgi:hypothetical protein